MARKMQTTQKIYRGIIEGFNYTYEHIMIERISLVMLKKFQNIKNSQLKKFKNLPHLVALNVF